MCNDVSHIRLGPRPISEEDIIEMGNNLIKTVLTALEKNMPHDRDGNLLEAGDFVVVHCVVTNVSIGQEYCNVSLETQEVMYPGNQKNSISLNAKQVVKVHK